MVASFPEQQLQVASDVPVGVVLAHRETGGGAKRVSAPSSNVDSSDGVRHRETLENWYSMRDTVSRIQDDARCAA